ncbi:hypothetical protein Pryu01_03047 [Paraliobacillus ryukyuensis]|uniref:Uncharacterized protein n=1 Tax=Paraliobacillus ryukyuensis TaxID=200904 RepID=A0A366DSV3_9BACI|nr:hypothetical protein [Paraliobacillus ryukyuensis]RBO92278.1 hypothetical protein DES48_11516 [Paraliobacillus ryukyuensis]
MRFETRDYYPYLGQNLSIEEMEERIIADTKQAKALRNSDFDRFAFKMILSPDRKDKMKLPPKPVKKSRYAQQLFEIGAGWNE